LSGGAEGVSGEDTGGLLGCGAGQHFEEEIGVLRAGGVVDGIAGAGVGEERDELLLQPGDGFRFCFGLVVVVHVVYSRRMDERQQRRIGRLLEVWFNRLNAPSEAKGFGARFFYNKTTDMRRPFTVAQKADPGCYFEGGKKFFDHGGPTIHQLEVLEATSSNDEDFFERLRKLVFDKIDTTSTIDREGKVSEERVEQIARNAVLAVLRQISDGQMTVQQAEAKIAADEVPIPVGSQEPPPDQLPAAKQQQRVAAAQDNKAYLAKIRKQSLLMQRGEPKFIKCGRIDMRWLRAHEDAWKLFGGKNSIDDIDPDDSGTKEGRAALAEKEAAEAAERAAHPIAPQTPADEPVLATP